MSNPSSFTNELLQLCGQVRDQSLTPTDAERLNALLAEHASARQFYLRFMSLTAALETQPTDVAITQDAASETDDVAVLLDLLQMEQAADAPIVQAGPALKLKGGSQQSASRSSLSEQINASLALFAAKQAVRSKPVQWLAAAAVIALGIFVALQFISPDQSQQIVGTQSDTNDSREPTGTGPALTNAVATITAERDAVWTTSAEGASAPVSLQPGTALTQGQRLTLTQGFAEITTNRGAIAILQSPATIQLTDNNNALQLHSGKLVGICETETSKGFLVRTPHMDVTDLGTWFGVEVSAESAQVHVFDGEVQVDHTSAGSPKFLTAGQAVIGSASAITRIDTEMPAFAAALDFASGVYDFAPRFEGDAVVWTDSVPKDLGLNKQESNKLQVYLEQRDLRLAEAVPVDLMPSAGVNQSALQIEAGQRVDVYLLHLDTVNNTSVDGKYTLHFDRPVLGVITSADKLFLTDTALGDPSVRYPDPGDPAIAYGRGIDLSPKSTDQVTVDQQSVHLRLGLVGYMDQVRILVSAKQTPPKP